MIRAGILSGMVALAGCSDGMPAHRLPTTDAAPQRIVSINPCVDAILMEIADPRQIAGISHYSHDPRASSISMAEARHYVAVSGNAEDVIHARPDLVISGPHVSIQTLAALKRLGIPLMQLTVPESIAESKSQIDAIAVRIGRTAQGRQLNRRIDAAVAHAARHDGPLVPALIWQSSGLVPGKNTLADELMTRAGFRNLSGDLGLKQWDRLPLEGLLMQPPQLLLAGMANMGAGDGDANRMLSHPALKMAGTRIRIADYPSSLLHCGGPVIIRAMARLAAVRSGLKGGDS
ncbi:ABC transporter substrate-binding protein [Aquisediminimonas sediminicola]|uniref:ABC transporter substrate-binding protein n=1 Tax=Alteraquisediminimonas sediminicola TaxID=2676787 RepID=UPI001FE965CF|nr:ABC transporter substrate-binding protein [Aquisediminimonas sediminicola]